MNERLKPPPGLNRGRKARRRFKPVQDLIHLNPDISFSHASVATVSDAFLYSSAATQLPFAKLEPLQLLDKAQLSRRTAESSMAEIEAVAQAASEREVASRSNSAAALWPFERETDAAAPAIESPLVEEEVHGLEQPAFDDDPFYDSHDALRDYSKKHSRLWMMIQRVMTNRRVSQAVVALVLLVFASTLQVAPWNERFGGEVEKTQSSFSSLMAAVTRPIQDRAAFFIVDNFQDGLDDWLNSDAMKVDPSGFVTVDNGLALRSDTLNFVSYRMDFHAKIESGAVGWVVRASNEDNYYAFKLVESKRRNGSSYHLLRYPVVDGVKSSKAAQVRIPVPANIVHDDFNRLSVRVRDQHITTLINGFGVDFWRDDTFDRGGIGFLADGQERARISRVSVTGNDDTWGLILYGTMETVRTLREKFSPRMAVVLTPVPVKALNRY